MALPKQVQKQLKEVEAYEKALEAQRNPEAVQDTDPEPLETGAEVVTETEEVTAPEEVEVFFFCPLTFCWPPGMFLFTGGRLIIGPLEWSNNSVMTDPS